MNWLNLLLTFLGNGFLLAALAYYFDRRLKTLESELKLKSLIQETVFKNSAATIKEATKRIIELKQVVEAYSMVMPRTDYKPQKDAVLRHYSEFRKWFAVESLHLSDALKVDVNTVFNHLAEIAFVKGLVQLDEEMSNPQSAHQNRVELNMLRGQTDIIFATYEAKMKAAIGVS